MSGNNEDPHVILNIIWETDTDTLHVTKEIPRSEAEDMIKDILWMGYNIIHVSVDQNY